MERRSTAARWGVASGLTLSCAGLAASVETQTPPRELVRPASSVTRLRGTLVDGEGRPFASRAFRVLTEMRAVHDGSSETTRVDATTTANGGFTVEVANTCTAGKVRNVWIVVEPTTAWTDRSDLPRAWLPVARGAAEIDVGSVALFASRDPARWRALDDGPLEIVLASSFQSLALPSFHALSLDDARRGERCEVRRDEAWFLARDALLLELARRGGNGWDHILDSELRPLWSVSSDECWIPHGRTLEWLTALHRLRREADPVRIAIDGERVVELPFAEPLTLHAQLVNASPEPVMLQEDGDYRGGRLERWSVSVTDAYGVRLAPLRPPSGLLGGVWRRAALAPGGTRDAELHVARYVAIERAGTYTLRVAYHDELDLAERTDLRGLVVCTAPELTLRVVPRTIELTRAELADARARVAALDVRVPVEIVRRARSGTTFTPPTDAPPHVRVIALGWKAVPALFERLDDDRATPETRAWTFALLYDVTGCVDPTCAPPELGSALGGYREITTDFASGPSARMSPIHGTAHDAPVDARAQAELLARWRELAPLFVTKLVD